MLAKFSQNTMAEAMTVEDLVDNADQPTLLQELAEAARQAPAEIADACRELYRAIVDMPENYLLMRKKGGRNNRQGNGAAGNGSTTSNNGSTKNLSNREKKRRNKVAAGSGKPKLSMTKGGKKKKNGK